jgi:O-antigen/teichoic acid export membrane protein
MNARHGQRVKLLTNTIFSGLSAASSLILLLLFLFAARRLGVEALGAIALGMAVGNAITFMLDLGVNSTAIRRIAADRAQAGVTAGQLLTWRLMVSLGCVALFVPGAWLFIDEQVERDAVIIFGIAGVLRSINFTSRALLQATDRFSSESLLVFIDAVALLLLGYLVLDGGGGPVALAWTFVVVRGAIALFYFFMSSRVIPGLRWKLNWLGMWSLQREGFPLGLAIGLSQLFWQVDIFLLSALATAHATGLYSAAFRTIQGLKVGPDSLGVAFYPRLSYVQQHEPARFDDLFTRGCKYVLRLPR